MNPSARKPGNVDGIKKQKSFKPAVPQPYAYSPYGPSPQLFDDTSGSFSQYPQNMPPGGNNEWNQGFMPQSTFPGQQLLNDPMAAMAMQYGQTLADQGKVIVEQKLEKFVSLSKMKYYFAVDTAYVTKKLGLLFFPFTHKDWSIHCNNENEPVPPKYDVNAPDLYIPTMAFITYLLTAGYILGSQNRFSPEQLDVQATFALGWSMVEIALMVLALYLVNSASSLKVFDIIAFCSYKYVCMVAALLACISFQTVGYYAVLGYTSFTLGFFLLRTLRVLILPKTTSDHYSFGGRQNSYLLLGICLSQPFSMYLLTYHLVSSSVGKV